MGVKEFWHQLDDDEIEQAVKTNEFTEHIGSVLENDLEYAEDSKAIDSIYEKLSQEECLLVEEAVNEIVCSAVRVAFLAGIKSAR